MTERNQGTGTGFIPAREEPTDLVRTGRYQIFDRRISEDLPVVDTTIRFNRRKGMLDLIYHVREIFKSLEENAKDEAYIALVEGVSAIYDLDNGRYVKFNPK